MWIVILMYALFASVFTVGKVTLQYVDPFFFTGIRMLLAGAVLILYLGIRSPKKIYINKRHVPILLLLSLFNVFITNAFEFWGLQYMETGKSSLIYSLSPFVAILLSYVFFSEKMSGKKWAGLFIGLIGFIPIFLTSSKGEAKTQSLAFFSLPEIALSISAFTAVIGWILMKKIMNEQIYPFITANAFSFLIGGLFSLLTSLFTEGWHPFPVTAWTPFILGLLYIAIIHNVICYNLYAYSLVRFSVPFMTFAGFTNPIFTATYGWIFLNEKVGIPFFLSLGLIILGIFLYSQEELKKKR